MNIVKFTTRPKIAAFSAPVRLSKGGLSIYMIESLEHDGFGYWLAGFSDGEACFFMRQQLGCHKTWFSLKLRRDDEPILKAIHNRTGIGRIIRIKHTTSKPQSCWHVERKLECQILVKIFDRYPLRAKKARDFKIWKEGVALLSEVKHTRRHDAKRHDGSIPHPNQIKLAKVMEKLRAVRQYSECEQKELF